MKISLAQLNYHIGNFDRNKDLILKAIDKAKSDGSELIIFSELCIPGYPPLDLLDRIDFVDKCTYTTEKIAEHCKGIAAIVGSPTINTKPEGKKLYNSALILHEGKVLFSTNKTLLPTYDIFDEYRYFEPGKNFQTFNYKGLNIGLTICEDMWDEQNFDNEFEKSRLYTISPVEEIMKHHPDILINIAASPFSYTRVDTKENIFTSKASRYGVPVISVNQTGANTQLIFDGASIVVNSRGQIITRLGFFEEEIKTFSFNDLLPDRIQPVKPKHEIISLIHKALLTGIKDYFKKLNFNNCIIGLSGGLDSAVVLCLATEALGNKNIKAILMPSRYSSSHSVADSILLVKRLGVDYEIINIEKPFKAFEEVLASSFRGKSKDITEENIQARVRTVILMAIANKSGCILLNTSNKSEAAVGYGTLYGDMAGAISVIGDVYKTDVYKLATYINRNGTIIPENILIKPPSAELKPDQLDTDSLPEYKILDSILYQYIEMQKPVDRIEIEGHDRSLINKVISRINNNEFKRYQSPPVLRISSKAFGDGRKMPLVAVY